MKKKKTYFKIIVISVLLPLLFFSAACANKQEGPIMTAAPQSSYSADTVIASVGNEKVTYALYKAAFESYAEYLKQIGYDPYTSKEDLTGFQELVIDALVADMVTLYHANEDGFTLLQETIDEVTEQAKSELNDIHDEYWALAETAHASDSSISVQQHFDQLIGEMSEFYTGRAMNFDDYSADYTKELLNSKLIEEYKAFVCAGFNVSDAEVSEWYAKQYESDEELYTQEPGQFKPDVEYFLRYGGSFADAYPPAYIPEGYSRIMDIVVYPTGSLSDEYKAKLTELDGIAEECSTLLFDDALNGSEDNADRIAELLEEYKALKAETDAMYDSYISDAMEKIERAYAELEAGVPFKEVMRKYTENTAVIGDANNPECTEFLTNGQYIAVSIDCPNDWSTIVKEIYSMVPKGAYSTVFTDTDGSLHIIYHGEDVPAGAVELDTIRDEVAFIVRAEKSDAEWEELLDEWMDDRDVYIDMDAVHAYGMDKLKTE